jgi:UDP-N-acetylglucosamine 2-epimerase (non-hydrolysing)
MKKIICVVGTRPEAIKMAPVIQALRAKPEFQTIVLGTAQHRQMLDQALAQFGLTIDIDLDAMTPGQSLSMLTSRLFERIDQVLASTSPDLVLAQGDTTTVFVTAVVCFYRRIPFGHVEAGLRTHDLQNPFPEEFNRIAAGIVANLHFAPTETSRQALLNERVRPESIHVTGNTVIDALLQTAAKTEAYPLAPGFDKMILLTAHRRENFGAPMRQIFQAVRQLCETMPGLQILYPVHPNPQVKDLAHEMLSGIKGVTLCAPLDYREFIAAMKASYFLMSDSGGVQEEAPALGKPVLVLREETERPEAIKAGGVRLVGSNTDRIVKAAKELLLNVEIYKSMAQPRMPYGDGHAGRRISEIVARFLTA